MKSMNTIVENCTAIAAGMLVEDEDARYEAARALARLGRPAVEAALELIASPDVLSRYMACYVLGQVSDPGREDYVRLTDGIPTLMHVLESDPDETVRGSAACALGHHGYVEASQLLCGQIGAASSQLRFDVAWALSSFGDWCWERMPGSKEMAQKALLTLTYDEDEKVRDWAVFGLHQGDNDTPEVRARFWEAIEDDCPAVRGEAVSGLAKFGARSLIPRLIELLEKEDFMPLYFEAAEYLNDPALLPAVLAAEQRWRDGLEEGEEMHDYVTSAVATLKGLGSTGDNEVDSAPIS